MRHRAGQNCQRIGCGIYICKPDLKLLITPCDLKGTFVARSFLAFADRLGSSHLTRDHGSVSELTILNVSHTRGRLLKTSLQVLLADVETGHKIVKH